nr:MULTISPECIES: RecX family transcriptional regulator [Myxococcaceae]
MRARARSTRELALALERRGFSEATRDEALERLRGWGYLDDARFARERAGALLSRGRLAPAAVLQRLEAQGVEGAAARAALGEASAEAGFDARSAARALLQKRRLLPGAAPLGPRDRARAARLLLGRGYSEDLVNELLGAGALDPPGGED